MAAPSLDTDLRLVMDTNRIEVPPDERHALCERVTKAPVLTLNEKREALG